MKRLVPLLLRPLLLSLLVLYGTALFVRMAPGYYSDPREMDARGGAAAYAAMTELQAHGPGVISGTFATVAALLHGKFGESRLYHVPVASLLRPRWAVTLSLMAEGLGAAWSIALLIAVPVALARRPISDAGLVLPVAVLLAVPSGALATLCVVSGRGGPVLVVAAICAPRIFKYLLRLLKNQLEAPYLLHARACGIGTTRLLISQALPVAAPELLALFATSAVMALGAVVPVEVIFDIPGVAQLAWSAALNRDQPVLLATSLPAAGAVAFASMLADAPAERLS